MQHIQPINRENFFGKRWKRIENYSFVANETVCPVTIQELPKLMAEMPIALTQTETGFRLVAILGLRPETNAFVDSIGRWDASYMPASLRSYPFLLAKNAENEDQLLFCLDCDSGILTEDSTGELFYDEEGNLTETVQSILNLLSAMYTDRQVTERVCKLLDDYELIKPWDIVLELDGDPTRLEGLYSIDEAALNNLSDADFLELRRGSALPVAYCQLLSMQKISPLALRVQQSSDSNLSIKAEDLNLDSFNEGGNINLDNI